VPETNATPRATRRSRGEPRRLLLDAARDLFARQDYRSTTTREIAEAAGVAEHLLFRNFGSKAALFREALVVPFTSFVDAFGETWRSLDPEGTDEEELAGQFAGPLYDLFVEHRGLVMTLWAADALGEDERAEAGIADVERALAVLGRISAEGHDLRGLRSSHPGLAAHSTVAMVAGMAAFRSSLFGARPPSRQAIVDELTQAILHAMYHDGRKFRRSRDRRAVERMTDLGKRILADRWPTGGRPVAGPGAGDPGHRLRRRGQRAVPGGVHRRRLLMQMLGDDGVAAPRLVGARLDDVGLRRAWGQFVDGIERLTDAGVVHADLALQRAVVARPAVVHRLPAGRRPGGQPPRLRPAAPRRHHHVHLVHPPGPRHRPRRRGLVRQPPHHRHLKGPPMATVVPTTAIVVETLVPEWLVELEVVAAG